MREFICMLKSDKEICSNLIEIVHEINSQIKTFTISIKSIFYNNKQCSLITFHDITPIKNLAKIKKKHEMLDMYTSSVSNDMLVPIKGVIHFIENLKRKLKG